MNRLANRLCLALDNVGSLDEIRALLVSMKGLVGIVKINSAFTLYHKAVVDLIHELEFAVWVDIKCKDVPRTVASHVLALRQLGVEYVTVHLDGGSKMIQAAVKAATEETPDNLPAITVIGVTVLTSLSDEMLNSELGTPGSVEEQVVRLARLGYNNGVNHIVCAPIESNGIHNSVSPEIKTITPGIRFRNSDVQDQNAARVTTPSDAICKFKAYVIVMGTELINGGAEAAQRALDEIAAASQSSDEEWGTVVNMHGEDSQLLGTATLEPEALPTIPGGIKPRPTVG